MIEQQLTLSDLPVSSSEIYEMMGYGNQTVPEPEIEAETQKLLKQISAIARPSFLFFSISVFEFLYRQVFFSRLFSTKFFYGIKKAANIFEQIWTDFLSYDHGIEETEWSDMMLLLDREDVDVNALCDKFVPFLIKFQTILNMYHS